MLLFTDDTKRVSLAKYSTTVSVSSAERSFSTLRRVKSWLRTRMGEDRLIGLTLLNIHWNIDEISKNLSDHKVRPTH